MPKEINIEQLKKIQLDILLKVKEFCDEHNLQYFLYYGSLLGAVRHKGYIPWDEDIDIIILAEDEDRFKNILWVLKEKGFQIIRYERGGLYSVSRKEEYIDFYIL